MNNAESFATKFEQQPIRRDEKWESEYEAEVLIKMVEDGEVKGYKEAEELLSERRLGFYLEKVTQYETVRDDAIKAGISEGLQYNTGSGYEDTYGWLRDIESKGVLDSSILKTAETIRLANPRTVEGAMMGIDFEKGLALLGKAVEQTKEQSEHSLYLRFAVDSLVRAQLTPERLPTFLESPVADVVSADVIVGIMNKRVISAEAMAELVKKYGDHITYHKQHIFGDKSIYRGFSDRDVRELEALNKGAEELFTQDESEVRQRGFTDGDGVMQVTQLLREAVEHGVLQANPKQTFARISGLIKQFYPRYTPQVMRDVYERVGRLEIAIEKATDVKPETITGQGLEFAPGSSGTQKLYLNGELLTTVSEGEFSDQPTNGDVVAWVTREVIDRDSITGTQTRDNIYVMKKGWSQPKRAFEDHAWSSERYFRVDAPRVTEEGKVVFSHVDGEEVRQKEIEIK